jgi:hypothetical protein
MLVNVRPSNEALLRARVPGAQDQRRCPFHLLYREGAEVNKKGAWLLPLHPLFHIPSAVETTLSYEPVW